MKRAAAVVPTVGLLLLVAAVPISCKSGGGGGGSTDGGGGNPPATQPVVPVVHDVEIEKELMITDLSVVNDGRANGPDGPWSFGHLMKQMAGDGDVSPFIVNWLKTWEVDQTINTFTVAARPSMRQVVIDPWKAKDHPDNPGIDDGQWKPKLENAPFRLLAIVNRLDLNRGTPARVDSAGEGRFVFGVLGPTQNNPQAREPLPFTIIFEYELLARDRDALRGWARSWHALGTMQFGDAYNAALQQITDRFSKKGAAPSKPNGSALNQLRTNEIVLDFAKGWELREFVIGADGMLQPATVKQTPANEHHNQPALAEFINNHTPGLVDKTEIIPEKLDNNGPSFLAGSAIVAPPTPPQPFFFWTAPGVQNNEARHGLGFLSCNGCHQGETGTTSFLHVENRRANEKAVLSGFLNGVNARDPVNPRVSRRFNDLEIRAEILKLLAAEPGAIRLENLRRSRAGRVH